MRAPKPISLSSDVETAWLTGWTTGKKQGVSMVLPPTVILPILPRRSVSLTSNEKVNFALGVKGLNLKSSY